MKHLVNVKMTYWQHFCGALWYAFWLGLAVMALVVHAIIPCVFEKTASSIVEKVYRRMTK